MTDRSLLVRALWFVAIGWWLTPIVLNLAWLLNATIVLLPFGIKLINLAPLALTLKEPDSRWTARGGAGGSQHSLLARALYFVAIGWWLSLAWINVAAVLAVSIVGLPIAYWMINKLPFVTSLYRYRA